MQYPEQSGGVAISSLRSGRCNGPAHAIHCNSRVLMNGKNMGLFPLLIPFPSGIRTRNYMYSITPLNETDSVANSPEIK